MANPVVSVITPCYNAADFVNGCMDSVQAQPFGDWEHIIVDDCSVDASAELVKEQAAADKRIRLIRHEHNQGAAAARNTAVEAARGRYIAFLDADDLWLPAKLEKQVGLMRENDWAFSCSDYSIIDTEGNIVKESVGIPATIDYSGLLKNTVIGCLTVVIDRERIVDLTMPDLRSGQDYALWYRILRSGVVAHGVDEVLAQYRLVPGSVSRNKLRAARRMWRLYREYERINPLLASWYFLHYAVNAVRKHI